LVKYALPKAARVAQHETYNLLRANGVIAKIKRDSQTAERASAPLIQSREANKITSFLAEVGAEFHKLAALAATASEMVLHSAYQNAERELKELQDSLLADTQPKLEEIEENLEKI